MRETLCCSRFCGRLYGSQEVTEIDGGLYIYTHDFCGSGNIRRIVRILTTHPSLAAHTAAFLAAARVACHVCAYPFLRPPLTTSPHPTPPLHLTRSPCRSHRVLDSRVLRQRGRRWGGFARSTRLRPTWTCGTLGASSLAKARGEGPARS